MVFGCLSPYALSLLCLDFRKKGFLKHLGEIYIHSHSGLVHPLGDAQRLLDCPGIGSLFIGQYVKLNHNQERVPFGYDCPGIGTGRKGPPLPVINCRRQTKGLHGRLIRLRQIIPLRKALRNVRKKYLKTTLLRYME